MKSFMKILPVMFLAFMFSAAAVNAQSMQKTEKIKKMVDKDTTMHKDMMMKDKMDKVKMMDKKNEMGKDKMDKEKMTDKKGMMKDDKTMKKKMSKGKMMNEKKQDAQRQDDER